MATDDNTTGAPKPNQISQKADYGTIQANSPWDPPAPRSDGDTFQDPYSPGMLGGGATGSMDHNSAWLNPTSSTGDWNES